MNQLPFNLDLIQFIADHRNAILTKFFLLASFFGSAESYILIVIFIYVIFDKRIAIRLCVMAIFAASFNSILKIIIKNPRPFIREGTYINKWAVSPENAGALAAEYSTPSGHAMGSASFYPYLYSFVKNRYVRISAVTAIIVIGLSRPYLGVHYFEDILTGWIIGLAIAFAAVRYDEKFVSLWGRLSYFRQIAAAIISSIALCLITIALNGWIIDGKPRELLGYTGFLTGIVIAAPLESKIVNFDPRSSNPLFKILRFILAFCMVILTLWVLERLFGGVCVKFSIPGYFLQYVRYLTAGLAGIFFGPLVFIKLGLSEKFHEQVQPGRPLI